MSSHKKFSVPEGNEIYVMSGKPVKMPLEKGRYLLRFETFVDGSLEPVPGYKEHWFRFRWSAVWARTDLVVGDLNPNAVGIWRLYDTKTGSELI